MLLSLGVLSTAGEWGNRSIQTTFLLVPQRGRVVAAKGAAVALMGAVLAAIAISASAAVLSVGTRSVTRRGTACRWPWAISVAAGAAFAVIGAGVGGRDGEQPPRR